jgi:hypothetical protein
MNKLVLFREHWTGVCVVVGVCVVTGRAGVAGTVVFSAMGTGASVDDVHPVATNAPTRMRIRANCIRDLFTLPPDFSNIFQNKKWFPHVNIL